MIKKNIYVDCGYLTTEIEFLGIKFQKKVKPGKTRYCISGIRIISKRNNYKLKDLLSHGYDFPFACNNDNIVDIITKNKDNKHMLLVNSDSIGDYILWRNFIDEIKYSKKYKDYKISIIACSTYKLFLEYLDRDKFVDVFYIPGRFEELSNDELITLRNNLHKQGLSYYYDTIVYGAVNASRNDKFRAEQLITSNIAYKYSVLHCNSSFKKNAMDLLKFTFVYKNYFDTYMFDFDRSKEFFSKIIEDNISIKYPKIDMKKHMDTDTQDVVINPSGFDAHKRWHMQNWSNLITWLCSKGYEVSVVCLEKDREFCETMNALSGHQAKIFVNLPIDVLLNKLNDAKLYIGADSGIFHVSAALDIKCIALSSGITYFRFLNYPKERKNVRVIFPEGVENWILENKKSLPDEDLSNFSINSISLQDVTRVCEELLSCTDNT